MKKALIIVAVFILVGCTQPDKAIQVLNQQGYTSVQITGWEPFMCGEDDFYSTGFTATAVNGDRVSGAVTSGFFFKGNTVRLK